LAFIDYAMKPRMKPPDLAGYWYYAISQLAIAAGCTRYSSFAADIAVFFFQRHIEAFAAF